MKTIPQPYLPPSRAECSCGDARRAAGLLFGIALGYFSFIYSLLFTPFRRIYDISFLYSVCFILYTVPAYIHIVLLSIGVYLHLYSVPAYFIKTVLSCHLHVYSYHLSCLGACCAALRQELSVYVAAYDAGLLKRRYCILCV